MILNIFNVTKCLQKCILVTFKHFVLKVSQLNLFICDPGAQNQSLGYICSNSQKSLEY